MKYIYFIIAIVLAISVFSFYFLLPDKKMVQTDIAVTVNGHDLTRQTIDNRYGKFGYHSKGLPDIVDEVITREILLQEAQKQGIDKEPSFREALRNYYENSLIKVLLDRKNNAIEVSVSNDEINRYLSFSGKLITYTKLDHIPASPGDAAQVKGVTSTVLFDDLALTLRLTLYSLSPGEFAVTADTGSEQYGVRLDKVNTSTADTVSPPSREKIRGILIEFKREREMRRWLSDLRKKASITIHKTTEKK
jgi:hypothetical protein